MGIYTRGDSPFWWYFNEQTKERIKTEIRVGVTTQQRRDARQLASDLYHQVMNAHAARVYKLPTAMPAIRFAAYADHFDTHTLAHRKGRDREREMLATLRQFFGRDTATTKNQLLTAIDRDLVKQFHTWRRPDAAPRTINREVDLLKAMLRDAVPKYLSTSPLVGMPRLPVVQPKRRLLKPEEETQLLAVATDPQDAAILILGLDTLVRLGDLLDLKRTDRDGVWIHVADPKNGEPLDVPLSPRAAAALDAIPGDAPHYFAKFRKAENPRDWAGSVRQRLEYLCRQVDPPLPYGRAKGGITFHWGTRRTGATRMLVKEGRPLKVVQTIGGWKKPDVLLGIYTEVDRDDLLAAVGQKPMPQKRRSRA